MKKLPEVIKDIAAVKLFSSMRFKIVACVIAVLFLALALMDIYIIAIIGTNLRRGEQTDMTVKAERIAQSVSSAVASMNNETDNYTPFVDPETAGAGIRCIIMDSTYRVVFDTDHGSGLEGTLVVTDLAARAMGSGRSNELIRSAHDGRIMTVAVPVVRTDRNVGAVYLLKSVKNVAEVQKAIGIRLIIFSLIICMAAWAFSLRLSRVFTAPMEEFKKAAKKISAGDFEVRLPINGRDEVAELSQAFNYMCAELEHLEEKRHIFVSDASHELKTPMATIKLICDTLVSTEEPDIDMVKDFLKDLSEEIDRLTRIVERLLLLTELDSKVSDIEPELVDYGMMLRKISAKLEPMAIGKSITLQTEIKTEDMQPVFMDSDKMWEAIYNIVDNAIKYSKIGGAVKIEASAEQQTLITRVYDSGPGVPDKFKEKIFERFYRRDDSRSRNTGGTGLGLAIAREIVLMHSGSISVIDGEEGGAVFEIKIPYNTTGSRIEQGTGEQNE